MGRVEGMIAGGEKIIQTGTIVEHEWTTRNEENEGAFWKGFPFVKPNAGALHENGPTKGERKWKKERNRMFLKGVVWKRTFGESLAYV
ncbi:MAG: hypothetical protein ACLP0H_02770 [Terriglobales bacterium]